MGKTDPNLEERHGWRRSRQRNPDSTIAEGCESMACTSRHDITTDTHCGTIEKIQNLQKHRHLQENHNLHFCVIICGGFIK
jgi:hypothetical protein